MDFHVSLDGRGDLAARIYRQLHDAILDGRLRPGERLPSTRELARRLDVSRNTVALAYERLTAEGFLIGRAGAGTRVRAEPVERLRSRRAPAGAEVRPNRRWRTLVKAEAPAAGRVPAGAAGGPAAYDFRVGIPDVRLFPFQVWRRLVATGLRAETVRAAAYGDPSGLPELRRELARYVGVSRGVRASADDVLVTNGAQQALDLIGRVLLEPGDHVVVEEPGYPQARLLFQSLGARVVGIPVDDQGLDVSAFPEGRAASKVRLVYTTPSHQFPLGMPLSLARRAALLAWAQRHDAVVVEDDYDSEFRFADRPLEPLQSLDRAGRVLYVGSFAKTMLPTLRVGFLVAPASLQPALRAAKQLADWHGDPVTQAALARFIADGFLGRHVRRATREYAQRHRRIVTALHEHFADRLVPVPSVAGIHLCARLAPGATADLARAVARARKQGVLVDSLSGYYPAHSVHSGVHPGVHSGLVIGYGAIAPERIDQGIALLARSLPG